MATESKITDLHSSARPSELLKQHGFASLFHLLHLKNVASIVANGLFSRVALEQAGVAAASLQSPATRAERAQEIVLPEGVRRRLDSLVWLRLHPRSPVLANLAYDWVAGDYSVDKQRHLVILEIQIEALDSATGLWFADDHPLKRSTRIYSLVEWDKVLWHSLAQAAKDPSLIINPAAKGELLFDGVVSPVYFKALHVIDPFALKAIKILAPTGIDARVTPEFFFLPQHFKDTE